ncbi:MAG: efflux RND transporter periplasmic adaptor subunit [Romboutsia sp.]|uniref:efflux RND transporter periplasmic adaptor subunit n=1 Tax=Romboutsia sp. TaxID=1965302 RepID=UPI003F314CB0
MSFSEKFKNKKIVIGVGIFIVIALGTGVFIYNKNKLNGGDSTIEESYIETYTIADNEKIFINGAITPTKSQDFNPIQEEMSKLNVTNGKVVKEGDLLYTIKNQSVLDEIDGLKTQVSQLKKSNTTNDPLLNTEISKLNAQISALDKKAYVNTYAPFAGKVYLNEQSQGSQGMEQTSFMTLQSHEFYMKGQASEQDLPKLQIDNPVDVLVFANNQKLTGRISFISDRPSTNIDQMNMGGQSNLSYYDVTIAFDNQEGLTNGFHVQASIEVQDSFVKIPTSAVMESKTEEKTEYYVFEDLNGILKKRIIEIYDQNDEFTTVQSGLDKNIAIIRYPSEEMKEGDPVNTGNVPMNAEGAEPLPEGEDASTTFEEGAE